MTHQTISNNNQSLSFNLKIILKKLRFTHHIQNPPTAVYLKILPNSSQYNLITTKTYQFSQQLSQNIIQLNQTIIFQINLKKNKNSKLIQKQFYPTKNVDIQVIGTKSNQSFFYGLCSISPHEYANRNSYFYSNNMESYKIFFEDEIRGVLSVGVELIRLDNRQRIQNMCVSRIVKNRQNNRSSIDTRLQKCLSNSNVIAVSRNKINIEQDQGNLQTFPDEQYDQRQENYQSINNNQINQQQNQHDQPRKQTPEPIKIPEFQYQNNQLRKKFDKIISNNNHDFSKNTHFQIHSTSRNNSQSSSPKNNFKKYTSQEQQKLSSFTNHNFQVKNPITSIFSTHPYYHEQSREQDPSLINYHNNNTLFEQQSLSVQVYEDQQQNNKKNNKIQYLDKFISKLGGGISNQNENLHTFRANSKGKGLNNYNIYSEIIEQQVNNTSKEETLTKKKSDWGFQQLKEKYYELLGQFNKIKDHNNKIQFQNIKLKKLLQRP